MNHNPKSAAWQYRRSIRNGGENDPATVPGTEAATGAETGTGRGTGAKRETGARIATGMNMKRACCKARICRGKHKKRITLTFDNLYLPYANIDMVSRYLSVTILTRFSDIYYLVHRFCFG